MRLRRHQSRGQVRQNFEVMYIRLTQNRKSEANHSMQFHNVLLESQTHLTASPSGQTHAFVLLKQLYILTIRLAGPIGNIPMFLPKCLDRLADQSSLRCSLPILLTQPITAKKTQVFEGIPCLISRKHTLLKYNIITSNSTEVPHLNKAPGHRHTHTRCILITDITDAVFREGEEIVHWMIPGDEGKTLQ